MPGRRWRLLSAAMVRKAVTGSRKCSNLRAPTRLRAHMSKGNAQPARPSGACISAGLDASATVPWALVSLDPDLWTGRQVEPQALHVNASNQGGVDAWTKT